MPARDRHRHALGELGRDLGRRISVHRARVHVARAPARVHQHERRPPGDDDRGKRRVVCKRADVVHEQGAQVDRTIGDLGLVGVDGNRNVEPAAQALEHRRAGGATPRRPAADPHPVASTPRRCRSDRRRPAPSRARRAIAASGAKRSPPSAKESGVTLTMPMTSVRAPSTSAVWLGREREKGWRGAIGIKFDVRGQKLEVQSDRVHSALLTSGF